VVPSEPRTDAVLPITVFGIHLRLPQDNELSSGERFTDVRNRRCGLPENRSRSYELTYSVPTRRRTVSTSLLPDRHNLSWRALVYPVGAA